jgi:hypothetical protein
MNVSSVYIHIITLYIYTLVCGGIPRLMWWIPVVALKKASLLAWGSPPESPKTPKAVFAFGTPRDTQRRRGITQGHEKNGRWERFMIRVFCIWDI